MKKTIALLVLPLIVLAVWVGVLAHGRMSGQMVALIMIFAPSSIHFCATIESLVFF